MLDAFLSAMERVSCSSMIKLKIIGASSSVFSKPKYQRNKYSNNVEFIGRVDDKKLAGLYQNALAFIFLLFMKGLAFHL